MLWNRSRWYVRVLRKYEWLVKTCIDYEVEGVRPRGRQKKTWSEFVEKDCKTRQLCNEDTVNCTKWRKLVKDEDGVWVNECSFWYQLITFVLDWWPLRGLLLLCYGGGGKDWFDYRGLVEIRQVDNWTQAHVSIAENRPA